jgi:glycosyltransferase involved in cell wall biosynthesis
MNNLLKIGIVLKEDYTPEMGGGYSYYSKIIDAIDKKNDWMDIEFVFIKIGYIKSESNKNKLQKKVIEINIQKLDKEKNILFEICNRLRFIGFFNRFADKKLKIIHDRRKNIIEEQFKTNQIDFIFDPTQSKGKWNHPFIITHWDIAHHSIFAFPEVAMNGTFEQRENYYQNELKEAFAVFCESEAGREELIHYQNINKEKVFVVPAFPGGVVDQKVPEQKQSEVLKAFGLFNKKYFFYPAQFWSHKNHYNLIIAFSDLVKSHPEANLIFTGSDKGNLAYIKELISKLGLEKSIRHLGFVSLEEVFTLYNNCVALVMPTFLGPTNLPLLEAAALGCPVIASDLKGHKEMLGEYAAYFNPADPVAILRLMINEMDRSDHKNSLFVNPKFSIDGCLNAIQESFFKLIPYRRAFGFNFKQF